VRVYWFLQKLQLLRSYKPFNIIVGGNHYEKSKLASGQSKRSSFFLPLRRKEGMSLRRQGSYLYVRWQIRIKQSQLVLGGGSFLSAIFLKLKQKREDNHMNINQYQDIIATKSGRVFHVDYLVGDIRECTEDGVKRLRISSYSMIQVIFIHAGGEHLLKSLSCQRVRKYLRNNLTLTLPSGTTAKLIKLRNASNASTDLSVVEVVLIKHILTMVHSKRKTVLRSRRI